MPNHYSEGLDRTFTHQGKTYRVVDIFVAVESQLELIIECADLTWIFDTVTSRPDPRKVAKADTTIPIIISQLIDGRYVVLDGLHRLAKTVVNGDLRIWAKFISAKRLAELPEVPQDQVAT